MLKVGGRKLPVRRRGYASKSDPRAEPPHRSPGRSSIKEWQIPGRLTQFTRTLGESIGYKTPEDYYSLDVKTISQHPKGSLALKHLSSSPAKLVMAAFPEHRWEPWRFKNVPAGWWQDSSNQRMFMDHVRQRFDFATFESMYSMKLKEHISDSGGRTLLSLYGDSVYGTLSAVYPEHSWVAWKFDHTPMGYFASHDRQLQFAKWFEKEKGLKSLDDWYRFTTDQVMDEGAVALLRKYRGSLSQYLKAMYPEHEWRDWLFRGVPTGWWKEKSNQLAFLSSVAKDLNISDRSGWYSIGVIEIHSRGGSGLLRHYGSLQNALLALYPDYPWDKSRFGLRVPSGFWASEANRREFVQNLAHRLGLADLSGWYTVSKLQVVKLGGASLLNQFVTLPHLLMATYPSHPWIPWNFSIAPPGFWNVQHNRKAYLEWLATELKLTTMEDFYSLTTDTLIAHRGKSLVKQFNASMKGILEDSFPEHPWQWWKLRRSPVGYWSSLLQENQAPEILRELTSDIAKDLNIKRLEEWYRISTKDLGSGTGARLVRKMGGLHSILRLAFPKHEWDAMLFKTVQKRSVQFRLSNWLKTLPSVDVVVEEYVLPGAFYRLSNTPITIDVYVDSLKLGVEYQGEQHYREVFYFGRYGMQVQRDLQKLVVCHKAGITLVHVPHWLGNSKASLLAELHQTRPDLVPDPPPPTKPTKSPPIKKDFSTGSPAVSLPRPTELATFTGDSKDWVFTPVPLGLFAVWDGSSMTLAEGGSVVTLPESFRASLPTGVTVSGFLVSRESGQDAVQKAIRSTFTRSKRSHPQANADKATEAWKGVQFVVSDLPLLKDTPFELRRKTLEAIVAQHGDLRALDLASSVADTPLGQPVLAWSVHSKDGPLYLQQSEKADVEFVCLHEGKMLCQQADGLVCLVERENAELPVEGARIQISHFGKHGTGAFKDATY